MTTGPQTSDTSPATSKRPTVYVVDDDVSVRRSMARLLNSHGFSAETHACAEDFLALGQYSDPSCLVLDVLMPGINGLELQERMAALNLAIPIVFITGHGDIPTSVKAMKAGAVDFLAKPFSSGELLSAVRSAIAKSRRERELHSTRSEIKRRMSTLTPREAEVFRLVVIGMMNKEIASELGVSIKTVKVHRGRVMKKMEAGSVAELVRMAGTAGITST